jgi:hypothetical protein
MAKFPKTDKEVDKYFDKAKNRGLIDDDFDRLEFDNWLDQNFDEFSKKEKNDDDKRLAGVKSAKKEGFTHTNKAKV